MALPPVNFNDTKQQTSTTTANNGGVAQTNIYNMNPNPGRISNVAGGVIIAKVAYDIGSAKANDGSLAGRVKGYITGDPKDTSEKVNNKKP